ncbi:spore cortex biosynthesis protein YabQ [Thermovorax subterraneus]|nr:spore cortex biosynthesis protein YabQ [Thermovorax subterraneus]
MNIAEVDVQLLFLAGAISSGIIAGLFFDIYRRLRRFLKPGPILTAVGDFIYWIFMALVTFYIIYKINYGQVRVYLFLGFATGLLVYCCAVSPYVIKVSIKIERIFFEIARFPQKIFKLTMRWKLVRLLKRIVEEARRMMAKRKY